MRVLSALPACAVLLVAAFGATFLSGVEDLAATVFRSGQGVLVVLRAGLATAAVTAYGTFVARHRLLNLFLRLHADLQRFREEDARPVAATPAADALVVWTALAIALASLWVALMHPMAYQVLIREDGIVEYASAISWVLAAVMAVYGALQRRDGSRARHIAYGTFILFFIVCGGEELSWGQRLLGFEGPQALVALNTQGETNLHNIGSITLFANGIFVLSLGFFLALPRALARQGKLAAYLRAKGFPVVNPKVTIVFAYGLLTWVVVGVRYGTLGFHHWSLWGYYKQLDDEIFELFLAYSFMSFAFLDAAEARRSRSAAHRDA